MRQQRRAEHVRVRQGSSLASVDAGKAAKASLGGDLVTLTSRLNELDKLLRSASGLIGRVLGGAEGEEPGEQLRELGGAGS